MTQQTQATAQTKSIRVVIDARCHNEFANGPGHASFLLTQELINTMTHLHALCQEHQLSEVRAWKSIEWHNKEGLRIEDEELVVVHGGTIWFIAYSRDVDSSVETETMEISSLLEIFDETDDGGIYSLSISDEDAHENDEPMEDRDE